MQTWDYLVSFTDKCALWLLNLTCNSAEEYCFWDGKLQLAQEDSDSAKT